MTREKAAQKIAKLLKLSEKNNNPEEAKSAKEAAEKLMKEFNLTEAELATGRRAAAFDDLMDNLNRFVGQHDVPMPVFTVIEHFKAKVSDEEKSNALDKIVSSVRAASFFFGGNPTVRELKKTIDNVLTKHNVTV